MKNLLFLCLTAFIINGCAKKIDDPLWLKVDKFQLNDNPFASNQGELTENITDAWVNMDGKILGVFSLPIKIPIIADEGEHNFIIIPGIKNNGISSTKSRFTLVEPYSIDLNLTKGDTASISPETQYYEDLTFWIEDFENINNLKLEESTASLASLETTNNPNIVAYGNYCGHIQLTDDDSLFYAYSTTPLTLPTNGRVVYMEVDFRTTHDLSTRFIQSKDGNTTDEAIATMAAQDNPKWTKIYFNLNELLSVYDNSDFYGVALRAIKNKVGDQDIYIDNIKVIY
ncbi:hypothetical protein SAMN05216474_2169 [Lishizhenia tianjinensis]|uniref:Uncharacterized protein n=1 Tax=Lishizhenia tianjinensis TaxID=477690 RepID=A0A1I7AK36_9FLAO|nr:hypothetical protein [Lishizhenia tianjinensis]SFT75302.1 hypothetical protein SAMN05216474_2169 [Lishizhenia tianjinensis]